MQSESHVRGYIVTAVKLLLKDDRVTFGWPVGIDSFADYNYAIHQACRRGHTSVTAVELLLKDDRIDPTAKHNFK